MDESRNLKDREVKPRMIRIPLVESCERYVSENRPDMHKIRAVGKFPSCLTVYTLHYIACIRPEPSDRMPMLDMFEQ